ncbi:unnamed protein product [Gordionus sp. m RMFG-2023]|uniref:macrophage migration inhibitory factor homolog n=1 Tax=Gordionus sp. m RMFG-2023 TaxID=3053472 RepID=UPI0030E3D260
MPSFVLNTNLPKEKIPASFILDTSSLIAEILHKPESYVCIMVNPGQMMSFAGSQEPCGIINLMSIGQLGSLNKSHSKKISTFIENKLGISPSRMYINFYDSPPNDVGYNGKTFG